MEKSIGFGCIGLKTYALGTKPAQPIVGNQVVETVEQSAWHDAQQIGESEGPSEQGEHPDADVRFESRCSVFEQHVGFKPHRIEPKVTQQRLTQRSLGGRQSKSFALVVPEDETGKARAKDAVAVENDVGRSSGKAGMPGSRL
jgi:hypothetical protein